MPSGGSVEGLVEERHGHVLVLRLDRPEKANALTWEMIRGVGDAVAAAEADPDVRAVVLTGTGERVFTAGMDLVAMASPPSDPAEAAAITGGWVRLLQGGVAIPVVAAVNGSALGGGFELMLGADLAVVAEGARLGLPEVQRGLIAGGNAPFLAARLPLAVALELALTGDPIDAARARELGLVNAVVPAAEVLPTALELATRIAGNAPMAVAALREIVRTSAMDGAAGMERMPELRDAVFGSEDAAEGMRAFAEKRAPEWRGR
jgi:enoyl-CoA hydratase